MDLLTTSGMCAYKEQSTLINILHCLPLCFLKACRELFSFSSELDRAQQNTNRYFVLEYIYR